MKKKSERRIVTAIVTGIAAVAAFACGAVLSACGGSSKILETPTNLQIKDEYLTWDEVEDAKSYVVEINGEEHATQTNSLDIMEITIEPITYKFTVFAVGDNEKIYDSDPSEEIEYTVFKPQNLVLKKLNDGTCEISATFSEEVRNSMTGKLIIPEFSGNKIITAISTKGFRQCENITSVYIPDSVNKIDIRAFELCTSLSRVRLSKNLRRIWTNAFAECSALKSLILPASLEECNYLTSGCGSLQRLEIANGDGVAYKSEGNCIIRKEDNALIMGCNASVIPDYVTSIEAGSFYACNITEIIIPNSVSSIGIDAFRNCNSLKNIIIPEGVVSLGFDVFSNCASLESISLPSTLVTLPSRFFSSCKSLKTVTVAEGNHVYKSDGNCIISKEDNTLVMGCAASIIPDYVTVIGEMAFYECKGLEKIIIPYGVTELKYGAFEYCHDLREIYIPTSVKIIEDMAFAYCGFASVVIPDSVETIGSHAFAICGAYSSFVEKAPNFSLWKSSGQYIESEIIYDSEVDCSYVYSTKLKNYLLGNLIVTVMVAPKRLGYTFLGWATEEGSDKVVYYPEIVDIEYYKIKPHNQVETVVTENVSVTFIHDYNDEMYGTTLYAVWQKND